LPQTGQLNWPVPVMAIGGALLLILGFLLPRWLWPLTEWPGVTRAAVGLVIILGALIVWFTFSPPDNALFADLSEGLRTFLTIPI